MLFCTQYQPEGWYTRIDPNPESDSPVSEAIMDRIIHNSYEIMVEGRISMRERKGLKALRRKVAAKTEIRGLLLRFACCEETLHECGPVLEN